MGDNRGCDGEGGYCSEPKVSNFSPTHAYTLPPPSTPQTARTALRVMRGFQSAQRDVLGLPAALAAGGGGGRPGRPLSIEMACAFVNNNVTCYDQSLTFVEDVQVGSRQQGTCSVAAALPPLPPVCLQHPDWHVRFSNTIIAGTFAPVLALQPYLHSCP